MIIFTINFTIYLYNQLSKKFYFLFHAADINSNVFLPVSNDSSSSKETNKIKFLFVALKMRKWRWNDRSFPRLSLSIVSRVITIQRDAFRVGRILHLVGRRFYYSNFRRASINFPFCSPMRWRTGLEESSANRLATNQRIHESEFSCTFGIINRVTLECSSLFAPEERRADLDRTVYFLFISFS